MRLAFLGTPAPAVASLGALCDAGYDVAVVVTRPDRRRSRGSGQTPSPVKAEAVSRGIPVIHRIADLAAYDVDRGVVVAYGAMIPAAVLERIPMLNVHFSLLPRWRGAAPVERAILAGDRETGVSIMTLDEGLDTGPVHLERRIEIADATLGVLLERLARLGAQALLEVLGDSALLDHPVAQSGEVTYATKFDAETFHLDPARSVDENLRIVRLERSWLLVDDQRIRLIEAHALSVDAATAPGTLCRQDGEILLGVQGGALVLDALRPEGGRTMPAADWWRGRVRSDEIVRWR